MEGIEKQFKIEAQRLEQESKFLKPGSVEEVDWLSRAERLIVRHRRYEIIRSKATGAE